MWHLSFLLTLLVQAPAVPNRVVVGLIDGRQVTIEDPEFTGFIQGNAPKILLMYQQEKLHGQMPTTAIARIDFGPYLRGKPFFMTVTLRNGQKLQVQSEHRDFVTVKGKTAIGEVYINHPDPISAPVSLSSSKRNRRKSLSIQYLEFPTT